MTERNAPMFEKYLNTAVEAAKLAGNLLAKHFGSAEIGYKPDDSIVTNEDLNAEEIILEKIIGHFPEHSILSEERGQINWGKNCSGLLIPWMGHLTIVSITHFIVFQ